MMHDAALLPLQPLCPLQLLPSGTVSERLSCRPCAKHERLFNGCMKLRLCFQEAALLSRHSGHRSTRIRSSVCSERDIPLAGQNWRTPAARRPFIYSMADGNERGPVFTYVAPMKRRDLAKGSREFSCEEPGYAHFRPNLSPGEVLQAGAFGGTYFRDIEIEGKKYKDAWKEFATPATDWFDGLNIPLQVASQKYRPGLNRYKVKSGQDLEGMLVSGTPRLASDSSIFERLPNVLTCPLSPLLPKLGLRRAGFCRSTTGMLRLCEYEVRDGVSSLHCLRLMIASSCLSLSLTSICVNFRLVLVTVSFTGIVDSSMGAGVPMIRGRSRGG